MLALLAAVDENWDAMFLWLVIAFAVDGIDGPLARRYDVEANAPQFDGALLDLIVDYLTYVFIPAYALFQSGVLPGLAGWAALLGITFASAMYFAWNGMKTQDKSFMGFPGCWNMVVLVFFAMTPPVGVALTLVAILAVAMFLPLRFVHPVRTSRWRPLTLPISLAWTLSAGWAAWGNFEAGSWVGMTLLLSSVYLLLAGIAQQLLPEQSRPR